MKDSSYDKAHMMQPGTPPPMRIALSLVGLTAVVVSLALAYINPVGIWHWALLLVALACLVASRRVR